MNLRYTCGTVRILAVLLAVFCLLPMLASCTPPESPQDETTMAPMGSTHAPETEAPTPETNPDGTLKKRVALTYDDGPQYYEGRTQAVVDELAKYGFTATFFVLGDRVASGDALRYMVEKGCEIGIHGHTHNFYYDTCNDEQYRNEIEKTAAAIEKAVPGYKIRLMRPVGGRISAERLAASPYSIIMWSVDSEDWRYKYTSGDTEESALEKVNTIVDNIMKNLEDGDVILMHDIYESTYDATVILLRRLYEEGYDVVSVSELFGSDLQAGQKYSYKASAVPKEQ